MGPATLPRPSWAKEERWYLPKGLKLVEGGGQEPSRRGREERRSLLRRLCLTGKCGVRRGQKECQDMGVLYSRLKS